MTLMTSLLVKFKVQDFVAWKAMYDGNSANRAANGMGVSQVFQTSDDTNKVVLVYPITDTEKARAYMDSDDLKQLQQRGGVIPPAEVTWLNEA